MQSENPPNVKQIPIDPMLPESEIFLGVKALLSSVPFMNPAACARASKPHNPISSPSFLAELNVNADARASKNQREQGSFQPIVLHKEWSGVLHAMLPNSTVTHDIETALRFQTTAPPPPAITDTHYSWSNHTMATTNWKSHGAGQRRHLSRRIHLLKLIQGILPTNAQDVAPRKRLGNIVSDVLTRPEHSGTFHAQRYE